MDIVRNFIHISGITPEEELPSRINGQVIQHSDVETLFMPEDNGVKSIFQVIIKLNIVSKRKIDAPLGSIVVLDGIKEFKVVYSDYDDSSKVSFATLRVPYNTFIELPDKDTIIEKIDTYIMDAYFELLDSRRIYSHMLYLVNVEYNSSSSNRKLDSTGSIEDKNEVSKINLYQRDMNVEDTEEMLMSVQPLEKDSFENEPFKYEEKNNSEKHNPKIDIEAEYL